MGSDPKIQPIRDEDLDEEEAEGTAASGGEAPPASKLEYLVEKLGADVVAMGVSGEGRPFAAARDAHGVIETLPVRGKSFAAWIHMGARRHRVSSIPSQLKSDLVEHFAGLALGEARPCRPRVRVAVDDKGDWLFDLGGPAWRAIRIRPDHCDLVPIPPLALYRPAGMLELPMPVPGGSLDKLKTMLNLPDDDDGQKSWRLIVCWLAFCFSPTGAYPILALSGEAGSAKTTAGKMLRRLVDPHMGDLRSEPREIRDLVTGARNCRVLAYDNLSQVDEAFSDALCRISTGCAFPARALYTDDDENFNELYQPLLITSIAPLMLRGDLIDRTIAVQLQGIPEERRKTEAALWKCFEDARPMILGALLDLVSKARAALPELKIERLPRLADFGLFASAVEQVMGWQAGCLLHDLASQREESQESSIESSPPISALVRFMGKEQAWTGTMTTLLEALAGGEKATRGKDWPSTAHHLSGLLTRHKAALEKRGISYICISRKTRQYTIRRDSRDSSESSATSAPERVDSPYVTF